MCACDLEAIEAHTRARTPVVCLNLCRESFMEMAEKLLFSFFVAG